MTIVTDQLIPLCVDQQFGHEWEVESTNLNNDEPSRMYRCANCKSSMEAILALYGVTTYYYDADDNEMPYIDVDDVPFVDAEASLPILISLKK